jgi:hypothetical protein
VWPDLVVVLSPLLDDDLGFSERLEDLAVEQFVAKPAFEAFILSVLPGTPRFDVERAHAQPGQPFT